MVWLSAIAWLSVMAWSSVMAWPKVWSATGTVPEMQPLVYPKGGNNPDHDSRFQKAVDLGYKINDFPVYVNETTYFDAELPTFKEVSGPGVAWSHGKVIDANTNDIRKADFDHTNEPFFAMIFGVYVATYLCGLSMSNLNYNARASAQGARTTPAIATSIARFHLYFHVRRFMKRPELLDHYLSADVIRTVREHVAYRREGGYWWNGNSTIGRVETGRDWLHYIPRTSNGLTKIGVALFQESCEVYTRCVLESQLRPRAPTRGFDATTSQSFRKLVEESINSRFSYDSSRVLRETQTRVNLAICPGVMLVPSDMIVRESPGFVLDNVRTVAGPGMHFGVNSGVNLFRRASPSSSPSSHRSWPWATLLAATSCALT